MDRPKFDWDGLLTAVCIMFASAFVYAGLFEGNR